MEQYTAKQWAEIEGGHTMSEANEPKFGFVNDLNEASKMYKTRQQLETVDLKNTADFAFMNLLTMHIMSQNPSTKPMAQDYAKRTLAGGGNFKNYRRDGNDLYHALHKISTKTGIDASEKAQAARVGIPEQQLKTYLRSIAAGQNPKQASGLFMRLERSLDIKEANYKSIRRMATGWQGLQAGQKQLAATKIIQYYRANAIRSELYEPFKQFSKAGGLINPNIASAEPKITARKIAKRAAVGAAAFTGGFAAGRAFGRSLV